MRSRGPRACECIPDRQRIQGAGASGPSPASEGKRAMSGSRHALKYLQMAMAVAAALLAATSPTRAQSTVWTGAVDSNWFDPRNWTGGVPNCGTPQATIDAVTPHATVIGAPGATALAVSLGLFPGTTGALTIQSGGHFASGRTSDHAGGIVAAACAVVRAIVGARRSCTAPSPRGFCPLPSTSAAGASPWDSHRRSCVST